MKRIGILRLLIINLICLGMISCNHNNFKEFVGPSLCPSSNFAYSSPYTVVSTNGSNNKQVDFSILQTVNATATFTEKVKWTLKIKGKNSGAVKYYSGNSTSFNIAWYGEQDSTKFFQVEDVEVTLSIACQADLKNTISVIGKPTFNVPGKFILISDFDGNGLISTWYPYGSALYKRGIVTLSDSIASPQGGAVFNLTASTPGILSWYFGGFSNTFPFNTASSLSASPDSVYLNMFLWSNGKINSAANITLDENGIKRLKSVTVNWNGWKLVSYKLSEANVVSTSQLKGIAIDLGSAPAQGTSGELNVDFIIFTKEKPFLNQ